ncbi:beta-ketoacyl-[acyl-carrier-protein] synthase family protein [Kribbella solani]|uniref:beta-ketoacyl-[acyl-carrier-protein] synthase family protein n=1 Tax=Kribbella solani TaxID=236067 RepID=UPI0029A43893|nr:beta-ketoacyl-[acyl-carrier-protein] synthase family protein [Kribbella solani]MDX2969754.1 beta-ketoacyl-[acyl-carrier-protein] synthase family protein [Kribbella solani]MDX3001695.1 beta-ketoacyl-[acyl-carrier-protein] synthase family protein [Kribbella solani]
MNATGVAITGIGVTCALGTGADAVWTGVRDAVSGIGRTKRLDTSTLSCHYSGEVAEVAAPPRRSKGRIDRAIGLALGAAAEALEDAKLDLAGFDPYRVGIATGTSVGGLDAGEQYHWQLLRDGRAGASKAHLLMYPLSTSTDAVSAAFGLKGPKVVISNACAAGANSIGWALDTIREGRADVMLAGGVDVLDLLSLAGFDSLKALDEEPCAPYSRSSGLNIGEGAAFLVLESEELARARGAQVLGYVLGYALTSDAHHATAPDPVGGGALRAMRRALEQAGYTAADVDYVNGHGTGTPANDSAERKAVTALFGGKNVPPMSSTKSQVGHMLGAAGALEAAVCALAMREQVLPPTVNVEPAEEVAADGPAYDIVPNASRRADLGLVVSNSFAFGGNNCSLVLGRTLKPGQQRPDRRVVITGAGVVSPIGLGRDGLITGLRAGQVGIAPATRIDTGEAASRLVAEITDQGYRRRIDPAYARRLDQLGTLVLAATRDAFADAEYQITRQNATDVGMVFGTYTGPLDTVAQLTETIGTDGPHRVNPRLFPNSVMNAAPGHACLSLQIKGPLSTLAIGCASGIAGLGYASDLIRRGEAEVMAAVSADELTGLVHLGYDHLGILTSDALRPYDTRASGCALGAGSVALVLESLEHAKERGATILAEVRGHAGTADAYRVAGNEESGEAWAQCHRNALDAAGVTPAEVGVVYGDARGTGTLDRAEARAIASVFPAGTTRLANISGQVGHIHSTTPLMSVLAATESLGTGWVPPIAGLREPLPGLERYVGSERDPAGRAAVVTAANWGGTYASVVLSPCG